MGSWTLHQERTSERLRKQIVDILVKVAKEIREMVNGHATATFPAQLGTESFSHSRIKREINCVDTLSHLQLCCFVIGPSSTRCCELEFCAPRFVHTRAVRARDRTC